MGQNLDFSRLTEVDGLPGSNALCFLKDNRGFLWIGTSSGLCKFDGDQIIPYTREHGYELSDDHINAIIQGSSGDLYLGTNTGGLNVFNPQTQKFQSYSHNPLDSNSISGDRIQALAEGKSGEIWIGLDNGLGLSVFYESSGRFVNYDPFKNISQKGVRAIRSIVVDKWTPGRIWLGTTSGLILFEPDLNKFTLISHPLIDQNRHGLFALDQIDRERLIAGLFHAGVDVYHIDQHKWAGHYINPAQLVRTYDLARKSDSEYWVAARKRGLAIFDIESGEMSFVKSSIDNQRTPFPDFNYAVYNDGERLWVGSKHGVSYSNKSRQSFQFDSLVFTNSEIGVVSGFSGQFDKLYISGYYGEGLWEIDKTTKEKILYPQSLGVPERIYGMLETPEKLILQGYHELSVFDKATTKVVNLKVETLDEVAEITALKSWKPGYALLLTRFNGVFSINLDTYGVEKLIDLGLDSEWLHDILVLENGSFYVSTNTSLYEYNPEKDSLWAVPLHSLSSKKEKHIVTIKRDRSGIVWMGTFYGLLKIENGKETLYNMLNSDLPGNSISQITFDKNDDLWVVTHKGITYINKATMQMISFDITDGFDNEGLLATVDGVTYYGTNKGYYTLKQPDQNEYFRSITTYLTDFQVMGERREESQVIDFIDQIHLEYWENSFAFSYAAPLYDNPYKISYSYRLVGLSDQWIGADERRYASFTNLDGGKYRFEVRAKTRGSDWGEAKKIAIYVELPFWETWWFYSLITSACLGAGYGFYAYRMRSIKRKTESEAQDLKIEALQKRLLELNATPPDIQISQEELNGKLQSPLSDREFEILSLSLEGKTNNQIADQLFISVSTVKFHLSNVYTKLGVSNRKEALHYVVQKS